MVEKNTKDVGPTDWQGRLTKAQRYRRSAEKLAYFDDGEDDADGIMITVIQSAIAYGDALTMKFKQKKGQDHQSQARLIKEALGREASADQVKRFGDILSSKSESAYGHRLIRLVDALAAVEQLKRVAMWAEGLLKV
ncbi:MAG: hypothetical protein H7338_00340 [Candidatus Sericytochromatia bacterium]|nr:hypothetical protein [Candidatus Sericytochromatia bacterium]